MIGHCAVVTEALPKEKPMKVLMLGWEYPPHIAGGLGVACEGLTRALSGRGIEIEFVVPRLFGGEDAGHMQIRDSFTAVPQVQSSSQVQMVVGGPEWQLQSESNISTVEIPSALTPYQSVPGGLRTYGWLAQTGAIDINTLIKTTTGMSGESEEDQNSGIDKGAHYGSNVFEEVSRYTSRVVKRFLNAEVDVIHAHDWMTYPAGVALARLTGRPLVVHVHSLDYDRSGAGRNQGIYDIERMGLHNASAVIAVSAYTRQIVHREYDVPLDRISVVHNGIYPKRDLLHYQSREKGEGQSVLFLGRVTLQKGPDYFIQAAAKVLEYVPDVTFVMAGSGDLLPSMVDMAHKFGIQDKVHFAGFLNEAEVEKAFLEADLYVMPSVSEPFGLSALEAISFDTPVLMSKQSGVGEVVQHSLKFDFWDVDKLADQIINGLIHEELRQDMIDYARQELGRVRWEASALRTEEVYQNVMHE
jgi:glycosyltransferase involved in cell wall biosynthesis